MELHYTARRAAAAHPRQRARPPARLPVSLHCDAAAGGHGLLGMRERAAAVGGELRTGAANGGGFVVEAILPDRGGGGCVTPAARPR